MTFRTNEESTGAPLGPDVFLERSATPRACASLRLRTLGLTRCLAIAAASGLVVVAIAVGAFFTALARGPLVSDWLVPKIVASLEELYTHRFEFELGAASIASTDHGPTLTVDGLNVKMGGRTIIAAPRAELSLDWRSLLHGRLTPRRLEVMDLELRLAVMADGMISVSAGTDPVAIPLEASGAGRNAPDAGPAPIPRVALLRQASGALRALFDLATSPDSPIGAIDRVGVSHARLVIDDKTVERTISYDDLTLSFDKSAGAMRFSLAATGPSGRWTAAATAAGAPGDRRTFDAHLHRLSLDEVALIGGFRNIPFDTDAPLSLALHFVLAGDGRVLEASGNFGAGAGYFRLEERDHEPIMVDDVAGAVRWDANLRQFSIEPVAIKVGGAQLSVRALATPPRAGVKDGNADFWTISAALAQPGRLGSERPGEKTLIIDRGILSAKFAQAEKKVTIEQFEIAGPDLHVGATAAVDWLDGPHLRYGLTISETPIRTLLRLWPSNVAAQTRAWFLERALAGLVRSATIAADFDRAALTAMRYERPPPDAAVRADFDVVDGALVDVLPGLPPFTGVAGHAHITGRAASFVASSGAMETAPGHRLTLTDGRFHAPQIGVDPAPAVVDMRLTGNVEAVAGLLALKSIAPFASLPIDASALKGQIDGRLRVDFELGANARAAHTLVAIDANTSNLSMDHFLGKERLENAALNVVSDPGGLRVTGAGRLYGAPATLDIRRPPGEKGQAQAQLSLLFDDAARAKAGLGFSGVTGLVGALVTTKLPIEDADAQVELDLTKAAFDNPLPAVTKPAGRPGKASFTLVRRPDGLALEQLSAEAGSAQASGVVELTREGAFKAARLSQARLSPGDDARIEAVRNGDTLKLVIHCANVDARPALQYLMRPAAERAAASGGKLALSFDDFDLDLKSPIVTGHGKQILANVDLKLERRGGKPRLLSLTGNFGREPFAATLTRHPNGAPQIDVSTSDGGSLLSFLDLYQRMESGALTASVLLGQGRSDGVLQVHDFYLKNEPAMRQLMTQGAARADDRGVIRFDPDSVRFSRVQTSFMWSGGKLSLREGVMSGPEIGLTVDGFIDFTRDRVDVSGAFVPAYALNSLLSNIPVLGLVLAGGQHEGVFALNYRIFGPVSGPMLNVNPLSVMAPGLLRKVFGIVDGTGRMLEASPQTGR